MGSITYMDIADRCKLVLRDANFERWTLDELINWIGDGEREVARRRPDATAVNGDLSLIAGSRQTLPPAAYRLITLVRNIQGPAIRPLDRNLIDAQYPDWHTASPGEQIEYLIYDDRDPRTFYVCPPALAGKLVEGVYSVMPPKPVVIAGNEELFIGDAWAGPVMDWALWRAFTKDAVSAQTHAARAQLHLTAFGAAFGEYTKADVSMSPNNGNA